MMLGILATVWAVMMMTGTRKYEDDGNKKIVRMMSAALMVCGVLKMVI